MLLNYSVSLNLYKEDILWNPNKSFRNINRMHVYLYKKSSNDIQYLQIAKDFGRHDTIGIDLVAMCVNDILAHGAEPLFFLDYFSTSKLSVPMATEVIKGITEGCHEAKCALAGI